MKESVRILETAGHSSAVTGMRLPTKSKGDSYKEYAGEFYLGTKDAKLARTLINKGSVHGKFQRGITAWLDINMPRYIWSELDTYQVGVAPTSSESTMYTLVKECKDITGDMFSNSTPEYMIRMFKEQVEIEGFAHGGRKNIPIEVLKSFLPEGWMQRRIKSFSYQTLRSIYFYRKNHRLPEWQTFCKAIEDIPYFEELCLGCSKDEFKVDGEK